MKKRPDEKDGEERPASDALRAAGFEPDPVIESYKRDIDRTLLRENLKKTPEERVRAMMALQELAEEARKSRPRKPGS